MNRLVREFATVRDPKVKEEIDQLSRELTKLRAPGLITSWAYGQRVPKWNHEPSFLPATEWRSTNMAEWIEVPAHRIYVICARELRDAFDYVGENGKPVEHAEISYRFVRKKDGKVFKWASFAPQYKGVYVCAALEEI
jgi:hypothetical protein